MKFARAHVGSQSVRFAPRGVLKTAVGIRFWQLTAERKIHRRQDDRNILRGQARFVAGQVSATGIDEAQTFHDDVRRTRRIVRLIKRELAFYHVYKNRTGMGVPASGAARGVIVRSHQSSPFESRVAELAYHFGQAAVYKSADKAVEYATRAGDHATATLAFENAAHWYGVALRAMDSVASNTDAAANRFELHVKRGRSFFAVGQWAPAKNAFEAAASLLDPAEHEKRAELLVRLAETAFWLMDVPTLRKCAGEAQGLADRAGRDDLWADAQAWMASAMVSDGDVLAAIQMDHQALARAGGIRSFGLARAPLTLYWAGLADEAIRHGLQAVETARASDDPPFLLYALQHNRRNPDHRVTASC